ncbi:hypothetical protein EIN_275090 [Entamoeba invadens IP1]|uniref:Rho-GAP domain-containing protein n=1 Tax=Entamoeba invadens IP1 TaxID=370355 RepID=A0A0A1U1N3_ENTIV|nr:hypothetical protein EIN_275090 [Entamoeba invadens IP1]ELP87922.1 hypothetical protein EIN_275090 [Entamoeba invadens IP1]|eukprot:XP_004254693.1 hypothetical protein EIN_275090 [Entamoeba invadens IP1]
MDGSEISQMRHSPQSKLAQETFLNNAKKNQQIVEDIKSAEKDLLKKTKKWVQSIAVSAHTGISVAESYKAFTDKFSKSDVGNIQRVCVALSEVGEVVLTFLHLMDQLQIDLDNCIVEPLRSFLDEELAVATTGNKLDSIKVVSSSINPKLSQSVANTQIAIDKFEIDGLSQFFSMYTCFQSFRTGLSDLDKMTEKVNFAKSQQIAFQKAFEENVKNDSSSYRNCFGIPLKKLLDDERRLPGQIPIGLEKALKYLYANGLEKEGLFRVSSTPDQINFLKLKFLATSYSNEDPHLVANVVKSFLKEIPGGLVPKSALPLFKKWDAKIVSSQSSETDEKSKTKEIIEAMHKDLKGALSEENYTCLKYVTTFLEKLSRTEKSKMTADNVATCVAPALFFNEETSDVRNVLDFNLMSNRMLAFIIKNNFAIFPSAKKCFTERKKSVFLQNPEQIELSEKLEEASLSLSFSSMNSPTLSSLMEKNPGRLQNSGYRRSARIDARLSMK